MLLIIANKIIVCLNIGVLANLITRDGIDHDQHDVREAEEHKDAGGSDVDDFLDFLFLNQMEGKLYEDEQQPGDQRLQRGKHILHVDYRNILER